jgi:excisionase family DNA binding protein
MTTHNIHQTDQRIEAIQTFIEKQTLANKEILTLGDAALFLGVSKSYLYKKTSKREIPFYRPGNKTIFMRRSELQEWIFSNRQSTKADIEMNATASLTKKRREL